MNEVPNIARIGALVGDNSRAGILSALMHGKALTTSELANEVEITVQTASSHLTKLEQAKLVIDCKQGRHKYHRLASEDVAKLLEMMMGLVADNQLRTQTGPKNMAMRKARVCYNHLAGDMGIQLYENLLANGYLVKCQGSLSLSDSGQHFIINFGINLDSLLANRSPLCRDCLDWSERRMHLAGSLGRALLSHMEALHWLKRDCNSRILKFTSTGEIAFNTIFKKADI